jgi:hypothetical protein
VYVPSYDVVDESGQYRLNVGSDTGNPGAFVMLSAKRPGDDEWTLLSHALPLAATHIPFRSDALFDNRAPSDADTPTTEFPAGTQGGANGATLFNMSMDMVETTTLQPWAGWQTVGVPGVVATVEDRAREQASRIRDFFTTINTDTGAPVSHWCELSPTENQEAFALAGNQAFSAFQFNGVEVDNLVGNYDDGLGIAVRNVDDTVTGDTETLFYPSMELPEAARLSAGWYVVTANADLDDPGAFGGADAGVQMVIEAGGGFQARTWIRDAEVANTLTSLEAGKAYFVLLPERVSEFTFQ